ncbi:hypothetical protein JCM8547_008999 [Rhodosporidiobolus lusitaniae]
MATTDNHACWIWKQHKRVCGENSNPFLYPQLAGDELELLHEAASMELTGNDHPGKVKYLEFLKFVRSAAGEAAESSRCPEALGKDKIGDERSSTIRSVIAYLLTSGRGWDSAHKLLNPFFDTVSLEDYL